MSRIEISVVMATFNGDKYIAQQLESILSQLGEDDEIVISDDFSKDNTLALIERYADRRIRIVRPKLSLGPILNFEHALNHARGAIIVLSDQDDVWHPERIATVRKHFSHSPHNYDLLVLDSEVVDAQLRMIEPSVFKLLNAGAGLVKNIYRNTYIGCHMAFKRQLLDVAMPFPTRIPMHDVWLGLVSELLGTVTFHSVPSMKFRRTGKNFTKAHYSWHTRIMWRVNLLLSMLHLAFDRRYRAARRQMAAGQF